MALNLVIAAINCWSTPCMDKAAGHLKRQGLLPNPKLLRHLAPLGSLHINLTGDYNWESTAKCGAIAEYGLRWHVWVMAASRDVV